MEMCSRKCLRSSNHRHMPCIENIMKWLSRTCLRFKDMFNRNVIEIQETLRLRWCQYPGNHEKPEPWNCRSFWCGNGQLWRCVKLLWTLMLPKVAMGKHWQGWQGWQGDVFPLAKRLPTNKNCSRLVFFGCKRVLFFAIHHARKPPVRTLLVLVGASTMYIGV